MLSNRRICLPFCSHRSRKPTQKPFQPGSPISLVTMKILLKVLVVTGGHGFEKVPFFKMFEDNPEISFTHAEHSKTNASAYDRDDLPSYDVVVLYDMPKQITDAQKEKFLSLFKKG